ncbi:MAG: mechanosensitive ion channel domain-containing protein [Methanomethylophilus sp.]|nr:mechanosensitive ion channel [Methanomethylophilus sp.]MDD4668773.1 mechanosensitive ion channel [Methanomethylophilus sp.]
MKNVKNLVALTAVLTVLILAGGTLYSDLSAADDETVDTTDDSTVIQCVVLNEGFSLAAGSSSHLSILLTNTSSTARFILVTISNPVGTATPASAEDDQSTLTLDSEEYSVMTVTITNDKYAKAGDYAITINILSSDTHGDDTVSESTDVPMTVTSNLSSGAEYNKIMGTWANPLPSPFDGPVAASLITAALWLLIGYIIVLIAVPLTVAIVMRKNDSDRPQIKRALYKMCWAIIILNAIGKGIRVLGVSEEIIDTINIMFYILYIIVGAMVAWRLYLIVVNTVTTHLDKEDIIPGKQQQPSSLLPLFKLIGKIIIAVAAVAGIMALLGFNLTAIITSAGIVSLGITMGAQNILGQFFSGLVILSNRPFKQGDLIQIGSNTTVYRVRDVNIMNTELENWDNTDITIVPNSTITSNFVKNITGETLKSKIHIFIDVAYGTDLDEARKIMKDVAYAHPRVVKDGSVDRPYTRVTAFEDSNIQMRLSVYVDDVNDSGTIGGELRQEMYNAFQTQGISIDYTHIVVHNDAPEVRSGANPATEAGNGS